MFLRAGGEIGLLVWGHRTVQDTVLSLSQDQLRVPSKPKPGMYVMVSVSEENKFRTCFLRVQALAFLASMGGGESHSGLSLSLASLCHSTGW